MIAPRRQKILIIDDVSYTRLMLDQILTGNGYKVFAAQNSGEAMQCISAELPDIILLSMRANDPAGMSTLRVLKDYFRLRLDIAQRAEPAIIILSNMKDTRQNNEAQSVGVSNVIFKPLSIEQVLDTIKEVVENKKQIVVNKRQKILLLDNETRCQQFLESVLAHETYDIEFADSEAEFMARIKHRRFDLSIVNLSSLEDNVIAGLKNVRSVAGEMPLVTIASSADRVSDDDLKEVNVQAHFIKPINIDVFRTEVDTLLRLQPEEIEDEQIDQESDEESDT